MHDLSTHFDERLELVEDFWSRRQNEPRARRQDQLFGRAIDFFSNHEGLLSAVDHCLPLYSSAPPTGQAPFQVHLAVHAGPDDPGPVPNDLVDTIQYAGAGTWLMLQLGRWGHCHVDLAAGRAVAVLSPQLAARPAMVSRALLNTVLLNFFIASGHALLHASCLVRDGRALLLLAPHNSGKSTTALHLALAGYPLLSDSMVFLPPGGDGLRLLGFPVGRIKLRADIVPLFPALQPLLEVEQVRGETKFSVDLRRLAPTLVHQQIARPVAIDLCLLDRHEKADTRLIPATQSTVEKAVVANSLYYDEAGVWRRNLATIAGLLDRARFHRLTIGTDPDGIIGCVDRLWKEQRS